MASVIQLILDAKNNASPTLKQVAKDVQSLDKAVGMLNSIASLNLGLTGLEAAIGTIQQIGQAISDTSQAGANFERLGGSFENLASQYGSSGQAILTAVESVTQGTLSQSVIMQQANNAMLLGVADSSDEFETLAKIAVDRGRAMGISMEYAFESIVKGVGRLSPLILDNLGIVLDADKTYAEYAATLGKTADALSDNEKRQALLARLKEEVSNFDSSAVMDGAAAWERLAASMENATAAAGGWINANTPLLDTLKGISDILNVTAGRMSDDTVTKIRGIATEVAGAKEILKGYEKELADMTSSKSNTDYNNMFGNIDAQKAKIEGQKQVIETLVKSLDKYKAAVVSIKDDTADLGIYQQRVEMQALEKEYANGATAINWYAKAMGITKDEAQAQIETMIRVKGSWEAAAPAIAAAGNAAVQAAQAIAQANSLLGSAMSTIQSAALQAYSDSGYQSGIFEQFQATEMQAESLRSTLQNMAPDEAAFYMRQFTDQATEGFKAVSEYANQTEKGIGGAGSATKQLTAEFSNLRGIVDGLVSSAYQDIGGADLSKYLPYQDAPAEDARRIASVMVEGYDSEWVDYFKTKFPDLFSKYMGENGGDIQKASAALLKDFQDGLRPELLDKGKIKELAKRALGADKEMNAMVDEISKDLANEMGISIEEAKAAVGGAAGVKKKPVTPEEIKKLFPDFNFAPKWDLKDSKQKFQEAGKAAGILNDKGELLVPVKVEFPAMQNNAIDGSYNIKITGFLLDSMLSTRIQNSLGAIQLNFSPNPTTEFYSGFKTNVLDYIAGKSAAVKIVPAAYDPTIFDNWLSGAKSVIGALEVNVNPTMSTETFEAVFGPIRTALTDNFITQEDADKMIFNLAAGMGIAVWNSPDNSFDFVGRSVGIIMKTAFEGGNYGQALADSLSTQLTQAQKTFELSAAAAGKTWGNAFLSTVQGNVPIELIKILTELVLPGVQEKNKSEKSRGGAEKK